MIVAERHVEGGDLQKFGVKHLISPDQIRRIRQNDRRSRKLPVKGSNPARVVFGSGTIKQLPDEVKRLGLKKPLVLSTPEQTSQADLVESILKSAGVDCAGQFNNATMHTPVEVTEKALAIVNERKVDGTIAIGGGSTIGLGKAIALRTDMPQIVIPTTYAGSEMTPIIGQTENGVKTTQSTPKVLPEVVIYDVDFTLTLPQGLSATSGINAIAHAVEALYAQNANPVIELMAEEAVRALARSLPIIMENKEDTEARSDALYGAWLCSACLGSTNMSVHHKLCHVLGGTFNLPHADTHTIVLPHALAYNAPSAPEAMKKLARALDNEDPVEGLNVLLTKLKVKRGLKEVGMPEDGIDKAADLAFKNKYWNPRPIDRDAIREVIRRAWAGEPARADI
ncbi:Dehydroquinate synthase-like protein [Fomitiporia mediterranea MF3/22]|uniref:Dehydroquinate synthase-like protein n=1 Tax=Fomitiporia mediterranea (strain MF3/22) TaxID=694068 RepID=UPI0004408596|nr:Dehydroquinate synthase-like protein [Fomitiporia mediterranea MF3/22]EJD02969.1 Dehydroquinate synthase-like protein [Fomitiporia mediterranea MF3/22]